MAGAKTAERLRTDPRLERDDSPPDKLIGTMAPKRPGAGPPPVAQRGGCGGWAALLFVVLAAALVYLFVFSGF